MICNIFKYDIACQIFLIRSNFLLDKHFDYMQKTIVLINKNLPSISYRIDGFDPAASLNDRQRFTK